MPPRTAAPLVGLAGSAECGSPLKAESGYFRANVSLLVSYLLEQRPGVHLVDDALAKPRVVEALLVTARAAAARVSAWYRWQPQLRHFTRMSRMHHLSSPPKKHTHTRPTPSTTNSRTALGPVTLLQLLGLRPRRSLQRSLRLAHPPARTRPREAQERHAYKARGCFFLTPLAEHAFRDVRQGAVR